MAFFHSPSNAPDANFTNLFRLLDDFNSYSRDAQGGVKPRKPAHDTFIPKFDVIETEHGYGLYGELPGAEHNDIDTEFVDPQTIVVSGFVTRRYDNTSSLESPRNATVEDVTDRPEKAEGETQFTNSHDARQVSSKAEPVPKYWVSERSTGKFSRTFTFPGRIDQDAVTASLQNGILKIVVPKDKKTAHRRIAINVN
ncbi:hypothetical protein OQA88_11701 [Cercophora sp. LCS_1]